jgi:hypothetical protein
VVATNRETIDPPISVVEPKLFFFHSGSDFQKVPVPAPAPATALELPVPVIIDFMLKRTFFMFLIKENRPNSHARSY